MNRQNKTGSVTESWVKEKLSELDLDIVHDGIPLTEKYRNNLNNWDLITNQFT